MEELVRAAVCVGADRVESAVAAFELAGVYHAAVEWDVGEPVEEPSWDQPAPLPDRADVAAYLPPEQWSEIADAFADALARFWRPLPPPEIGLRAIPQRDWRTAWHEHFDVVRIAARRTIVIHPPHIAYDAAEGEIVIDLAPGLAFGTGQHQSTRLALSLIADAAEPNLSVLDVGVGSGILAVAAAKLGAHPVLGVDTDPLAVDAARDTVRRNRLADRIVIQRGSIPAEASYDLILANLTADLLQSLAPRLGSAVAPGARLIASGFIRPRHHEVAAALAAVGFQPIQTRSEDDWSAILAAHRPGS